MAKQLARIRPTKGFNFDVPAWEVSPDYYTRAQNLLIRNGFAIRAPGQRDVYGTLSDDAQHILQITPPGSNIWIYCSTDKIWTVEGASHTDVSPTPALTAQVLPEHFSSCVLNTVPVINQRLSKPVYMNVAAAMTDFAALPGWPANTLCSSIAAHRYHLFALGISVSGTLNENLLLWSNAAEPGDIPDSWTPAPTNEAGFTQLSDTPGAIQTGVTLRDAFIVYKRNSAYVLDYVGIDNGVYSVKGLWTKAGAIGPRAVADINGRHVVVTEGDIVFCDGYSQPVTFADSLVKTFLFASLDQARFELLQVFFDHVSQDVWILFPETGETLINKALVYNIRSTAWGVVDLFPTVAHAAMGTIDEPSADDTWAGDSEAWEDDATPWTETTLQAATDDIVFACASHTSLVQYGTNDATERVAVAGNYSMSFDEPERVKFVRQVHVRADNFTTFYLRLGSQMFPDDPITWNTEVALTNPGQPIPSFVQGRYISYELRTDDASLWTLTGIDIEIEFRGYF